MSAIKEQCYTDFSDAAELHNFRVMADGSLERREGSYFAVSFSSAPRATFVFDDVLYAVCNTTVYSVKDDTPGYIGRLKNCTFADESEGMFIFEYGGIIHFIGGGSYYLYDLSSNTLSENPCYAPMIRYTDETTGERVYNESFNQIGLKARVHFRQGEANMYYLEGVAESIDEMICDETVYTQYNFVKTENVSYITFNASSDISRYSDIFVTYTLSSEKHGLMRDIILRGKKGFIHKTEDGVRLFLYDPNDPLGTVYYSEPAYDMNGNRTSTFDYFTALSFFNVGDGSSGIYDMAFLEGHVLMFNDSETFELTTKDAFLLNDHKTSVFGVKVITNERGISKDSGVLCIDGYLYLMTPFGLYRYSYNKFTLDFIMAGIEIPRKIVPDRTRYKDARLFHYRANDELWVCFDREAAVYNMRIKKWYRFTGFPTDRLFCVLDNYGYITENNLCYFSADSSVDDETPFTAVCLTDWYAPDSPFQNKTIYTFGAVFDNKPGAELKCTVSNDRGAVLDVTFTPDSEVTASPYVARTHARLSGSGHIVCRLESAAGKPAVNIRGIFLRYRNQGGRQ